jgi:hypothetical protein
MTTTRTTFNKRLILEALRENYDSQPPHSAKSIFYILENAFNYKWTGIYEGMKTLPNENQIRRTLRSLAKEGLIVGEQRLMEWYDNSSCKLPYKEWHWQLADDVEHNALITEIQDICHKVRKAKYGITLFSGVPFDYGALPDDVQFMKAKLKALMQKTHPDKATGYVEEFKQLKDCMSMIRSGIPLPTDKPPKADVKLKQLG